MYLFYNYCIPPSTTNLTKVVEVPLLSGNRRQCQWLAHWRNTTKQLLRQRTHSTYPFYSPPLVLHQRVLEVSSTRSQCLFPLLKWTDYRSCVQKTFEFQIACKYVFPVFAHNPYRGLNIRIFGMRTCIRFRTSNFVTVQTPCLGLLWCQSLRKGKLAKLKLYISSITVTSNFFSYTGHDQWIGRFRTSTALSIRTLDIKGIWRFGSAD